MSSSSMTRRYRTTYKKTPGTLYLTSTTLSWNADVRGDEVVRVQQLSRVAGMFQSKAGAARTSIKITFVNDIPQGGLTFVFTGEAVKGSTEQDTDKVEKALKDRQEVVGVLTSVIGVNNERRAASAAAGRVDPEDEEVESGPSAAPSPAASGSGTTRAPDGGALPPTAKRQKLRDSTSRSGTPATPGGMDNASTSKSNAYDLRRAVLLKHPELKKLYIDVVVKQQGKVLTEEEFWSGRQHLVQQESLVQSQTPGRSSQLLDDRFGFASSSKATSGGGTGLGVAAGKPKPDAEGPKTMALSQELIMEIFQEFPIVQRIYVDNVGGENGLAETEFWQRYFNSTLWDRHRASTRTNSTAAGTREEREKHDDVFDKYLEEPDDDLEPRQAPKRSVDMFLDLAATEEDHQETGNINDYTMQAGKQRNTLPLIRRFNEHSNRLVMRDEEADVIDDEEWRNRIYNEIELDDLRAPQQDVTYKLDVQDRQDKFSASKGSQDDELEAYAAGKSSKELRGIIKGERSALSTWEPNLPSIVPRLPDDHPGAPEALPKSSANAGPNSTAEGYARCKRVAQEAIRNVADAIVAANEASADKSPIPVDIMNQILSCHNAACEFLRQFWSAVLPNLPGTLGAPTIQQKADKAKKMVEYLAKTGEKVDGVVKSAVKSGMEDPDRVKEALAPTLFAVSKAVGHFEASNGKK